MDLVIELKYLIGNANAKSHTHLQSHHPSITKTVKEYVFATHTSELNYTSEYQAEREKHYAQQRI